VASIPHGGKRVWAAAAASAVLGIGVVFASEPAWTVDLPSRATVVGSTARLADLVTTDSDETEWAGAAMPLGAAKLAVAVGGTPGQTRVISARGILRQLVLAGLADGVRMAGAEKCTLQFAGAELPAEAVLARVTAALTPWLPPSLPEAPPSRLEVSLAGSRLAADGDWAVTVDRTEPLKPGTNLVGVTIVTGEFRHHIAARVTLHVFARTAVAARRIAPDRPVSADALVWGWRDLALTPEGAVVDSTEVVGMVATAEVRPGEVLRRRHLASAPLVRTGELVDLMIRRGSVSVSVRGSCRQDGRLDEVVSVRNELTGKLIAGRVTGPGQVTVQN
jgi:flagella basal body P-ring formation protein FlgA